MNYGLQKVPTRESLVRHGLALEALTISWNVVEAVIAITAGWIAGSVALVGFGLDSSIETIAAVALFLRLRAESRGASEKEVEEREIQALRIVGVTFLLLAAYVLFEAISTLWLKEPPEHSMVGLVLAAISLVVMPVLAWGKHRTGKLLNSSALIADAKETLVCSCLSLSLLLGLGLNLLFGWWWADPVAALIMVPFLIHEAREAFEEVKER